MSQDFPSFSVIIPIRSHDDVCPAIDSLAKVQYPQERIEIILVEGSNPSLQRNRGASQARGDILVFLDNDSEVHPRALQNLQFAFGDYPDAAGFGGPAIPVIDHDSQTQAAIKNVMQSVYAFGPTRKRYFPSGEVRPTSEQALILCNFALRKSVWQKYHGFCAHLYPNEENEFFNRITGAGERLYYHPFVLVYRQLELTPRTFIQKMFRYGFSRIRHIKLHSFSGGFAVFAPLAMLIYAMTMLIVNGPALLRGAFGSLQFGEIKLTTFVMILPLLAYALLIAAGVGFSMLSSRRWSPKFALAVLILLPMTHMSYGFGMLCSLFVPTRLSKQAESSVVKLKELIE